MRYPHARFKVLDAGFLDTLLSIPGSKVPQPKVSRGALPSSTNSRRSGLNENLWYKTPGDLLLKNAKFCWDVARQYTGETARATPRHQQKQAADRSHWRQSSDHRE
jgi:hypothetical protein